MFLTQQQKTAISNALVAAAGNMEVAATVEEVERNGVVLWRTCPQSGAHFCEATILNWGEKETPHLVVIPFHGSCAYGGNDLPRIELAILFAMSSKDLNKKVKRMVRSAFNLTEKIDLGGEEKKNEKELKAA